LGSKDKYGLHAVGLEQRATDKPMADAYAAELSLIGTEEPAYMSIRVQVLNVTPTIWREILVSSRVTLSSLHDHVLCPAFGYQRGYHAYAFRKGQEPWLGPVNSTAIDMQHCVFYIGCMGSDKDVKLVALLNKVGDKCLYVKDLGDWIAHRITVVQVYSSSDQEYIPPEMSGTAHVMDGANEGIPEDTGR